MIYRHKEQLFYDREMSWIQFNGRVLQESENQNNPLIERLRFLAIFSSNLDEFYRVRIASLRSLMRLKKKDRKELPIKPRKHLALLQGEIEKQQNRLGQVYRQEIRPQMEAEGIHLRQEHELNGAQKEFLEKYYHDELAPHLRLLPATHKDEAPFLVNNQLYLLVLARQAQVHQRYLLALPTEVLPRFISINDGSRRPAPIIFMDDVLRLMLPQMLPQAEVQGCYSFKLNRDGDLYLKDEYADTVVEKIKQGLKKRETGLPSRFLYDEQMPPEELQWLMDCYDLDPDDLVAGGRYHNFSDFWSLPFPDQEHLTHPARPALAHPTFEGPQAMHDVIEQGDQGLFFPYQDYQYVLELLRQAAVDPSVSSIKMTLYRVAKNSEICQALIRAAQNGKQVVVFDEVQARFDEQSNLYWGEQLTKAGAEVLYSCEGLKVHAKLCLIERQLNGKVNRQALLSTGNFNEKTAPIYADFALFTARPSLTEEVNRVFTLLRNPYEPMSFSHLLVAPQELRPGFTALIDQEIAAAQNGQKAEIIAKMNSLEDHKMVAKLYEASRAGVKIKLLVRGICVLVPGQKGLSENIKVRSLVGRYLEHARLYYFHHGGEPRLYAASADWMTRNLNRRVEVAFPIEDKRIQGDIHKMLKMQWRDNVKARVINRRQNNRYRRGKALRSVHAQEDFYQYLREKYEPLQMQDQTGQSTELPKPIKS